MTLCNNQAIMLALYRIEDRLVMIRDELKKKYGIKNKHKKEVKVDGNKTD